MNVKIEKIKNFRFSLLRQIEDLSTEDLNNIPSGHKNNIIWNLAHLSCAVQNLCYVRAGLPITIDEKYFAPYMSGTKPEKFVDEEEIKSIKGIFISSIDKLQSDFEKEIFEHYSPSVMIQKVYGVEVNNIDQAIDYLIYHEGFHAGYVLSLKHLL